MERAHFIYDTPDKNSDLFYATHFHTPDPMIYIKYRGKKYMVMSDLEIDRAKKEATVDEVISINPFYARAEAKKSASHGAIVHEILREFGIKNVMVPRGTSFLLIDDLRKKGYKIEAGQAPFYQERLYKTPDELKKIGKAQNAVFGSIAIARDVLAKSRIKGRRLIYRGSTLTSERLRTMINVFLLEKGFVAADTIVAGGKHGVDPHDLGSGPLLPNTSIIVDVYPRDSKTFYYGDATRTFCRGRAPEALRKLYATVKKGQALGKKLIKDGANGKDVHLGIMSYFQREGYPTGINRGRMEGFFHGTGHGLGLDLHEEPVRLIPRDCMLKKGYVVSVEPGLYYSDIGGVRIEDLVSITKKGCDTIGRFPKELEIL